MKNVKKELKFKVLLEQDENGIYVASVPAIPGCHAQGKTYKEAIKQIGEVIELCLEVAKEDKKYRDNIDFSEGTEKKARFLGVVDIPVRLGFSL